MSCMERDHEYYLKSGLDEAAARYFASGRKKIVSVEPLDGYRLRLTFDNKERRILDMNESISRGGVFRFLEDEDAFRRVYLDNGVVCWDRDPEVDSNEVWDNRLDICPDNCYIRSVPE